MLLFIAIPDTIVVVFYLMADTHELLMYVIGLIKKQESLNFTR